MSEKVEKRDLWGSRLGYIFATIGMCVGLGAMWRFPMVASKNGGGAFVLAYILISVVVAIPAGWAEIALGRKTKSGPVESYEMVAGKPGRIIGHIVPLIPWGLNMYYIPVIAWVLAYVFYTFTGAYMSDPAGFYSIFVADKMQTFGWTLAVLALVTLTCLGGIKKGIEKVTKIMLPVLFIILAVMAVRVFTLPGIAKGIEFYVKPDFSQWLKPELWVTASGMALFAIGLGPAFLLVYGSYLPDDADVTFDFLTVSAWNILSCVLAGFATIPAVILFNLDTAAGAGLVFTVLPKVFEQMPGTLIWAFGFLIALFFAGFSSAIAIMEVTVTAAIDTFKWSRKKAVCIVASVTGLGALPCIWSDRFVTVFDYFIANLGYNLSAAFLAVTLAWVYGAKKVREEWLNPTSEIKLGAWVDVLYKYVSVPALLFFVYQAVKSFFSL